jgi:galactoside O-acetyltransferase
MNTSFLNKDEICNIGLKEFGENVLISRYARFYAPELISIGNNVRIDDFCILSGNILLGSFIHISAFCALYGEKGIEIEDYAGLSARCTIYSSVDDFSGNYLIGPMVDDQKRNVIGGKVLIRKWAQIGASCVIMPNITIGEGTAVGAISFINRSLDEWTIFAGCPVSKIKNRNKIIKESTL